MKLVLAFYQSICIVTDSHITLNKYSIGRKSIVTMHVRSTAGLGFWLLASGCWSHSNTGSYVSLTVILRIIVEQALLP